MIHSEHRFHGRSSLRFVYQKGHMVRGGLLSLRYAQNDRRSSYRVAVVVSRKVSKSAVVRNRIRRRLYEIVRKHATYITKPYDLVITVYGEDTAKVSHTQLQQLVLGQLAQAGIWNAKVASEAEHDILDGKELHT